jgi:hypothetical protein
MASFRTPSRKEPNRRFPFVRQMRGPRPARRRVRGSLPRGSRGSFRAVHLDRDGRTLRDAKILPSMGSVGHPRDNAAAESCISTIKNELVHDHASTTRDQARLAASTTSSASTTRCGATPRWANKAPTNAVGRCERCGWCRRRDVPAVVRAAREVEVGVQSTRSGACHVPGEASPARRISAR